MKSTKNPNNTIGNRTHDLPALSAVPQSNSSLKKGKGNTDQVKLKWRNTKESWWLFSDFKERRLQTRMFNLP